MSNAIPCLDDLVANSWPVEFKLIAANDNPIANPVAVVSRRLTSSFRRKFKGRDGVITKTMRMPLVTTGKPPSTAEFLGYTPADLKAHLEGRFSAGMSWEIFSKGQIHIDHIRPISSFDLTDANQVRLCWALSNLQPLWALDNILKGATWHGAANDNSPLPTPAATRKSYWQNMSAEQRLALDDTLPVTGNEQSYSAGRRCNCPSCLGY